MAISEGAKPEVTTTLRAARSTRLSGPAGEEVDFVVEAGDRRLPVEVKASSRPRLRDVGHLRSFRAEYGPRARAGLLLHGGMHTEWLAPGMLAVPWWRVL